MQILSQLDAIATDAAAAPDFRRLCEKHASLIRAAAKNAPKSIVKSDRAKHIENQIKNWKETKEKRQPRYYAEELAKMEGELADEIARSNAVFPPRTQMISVAAATAQAQEMLRSWGVAA